MSDVPLMEREVATGSNGSTAGAQVNDSRSAEPNRHPALPDLAPLAELSPTPDSTDAALWRAQCPACKGQLEIRDVVWNDETGQRRLKLYCRCNEEHELLKLIGVSERDLFIDPLNGNGNGGGAATLVRPRIVPLEEFAAVEEPGAAPIVGEPASILIPQAGDVMVYGDGGAGKTTLCVDLAFHLGAGSGWLGMPVPAPVRVLLIENEGPRPLFRQKLKRKLDAWQGAPISGRVTVFEHPWAQFTFAADEWRALLAQQMIEGEVDVLIAGPLTRLGMDTAGTLQEVRAFMELVEQLRWYCERPLTVVLVHHENKGGTVSGAWEGAGDTLLHVQAAGNGHTVVLVQKARWDSERHGTTLQLAWADGEGFRLEGDRDYFAEVAALLADGRWRTVKDISAPEHEGGIGAGEKTVRSILDAHSERFESRSGEDAKALGRHPSATVWQVRSASSAPDAPCAFLGGVEEAAASCAPLKGAAAAGRTPSDETEGASHGSAHPAQPDLMEDV